MPADFREYRCRWFKKTLRIKDGIPALGHHRGLGFIKVFKPLAEFTLPNFWSIQYEDCVFGKVIKEGFKGRIERGKQVFHTHAETKRPQEFVKSPDTTTWYAEIVCTVEN